MNRFLICVNRARTGAVRHFSGAEDSGSAPIQLRFGAKPPFDMGKRYQSVGGSSLRESRLRHLVYEHAVIGLATSLKE